jgi:hypothetical protein
MEDLKDFRLSRYLQVLGTHRRCLLAVDSQVRDRFLLFAL